MRPGVLQRRDRACNIRQQCCMHRTVSEVFAQGFCDGFAVSNQQSDRAVEPLDALISGKWTILDVRSLLRLENALHFARNISFASSLNWCRSHVFLPDSKMALPRKANR